MAPCQPRQARLRVAHGEVQTTTGGAGRVSQGQLSGHRSQEVLGGRTWGFNLTEGSM